MIFMPPRHGKSELASRRFPAWFLGNYPDRSIIAASYNSDLANDFGRDVRNIVASNEYNVLFNTELAADSKSAGRWHTDKGGGYVAAGVGTAITGRGAHVLLIDDPFKDRESADSEVIREKTYKWYLSTAYTRLEGVVTEQDSDALWNDQKEAMKEGSAFQGAVVLIQTRWHEDDLAGRLLRDMEEGADQWEVLSLPAIDNDEALWPAKYPIERLGEIKKALSAREWESLYQQRPTPDEGIFFTRSMFNWYKLSELPPGEDFGSSDFATTDGAGDFTEHGIARVTKSGDIYFHDWWSGQKESDVWIEAMMDFAEMYGIKMWSGETGPIKQAIEPWLKRRMLERRIFFSMQWFSHAEASKEQNARGFQALASSGRVYLPIGVDWANDLVNQLVMFPAGRYDDKVDACSLFAKMINKLWANKAIPKTETRRGEYTLDEILKQHRANKSRGEQKRL